MKALFSESYYYTYWEKMLEKIPDQNYINLEAELSTAMQCYKEANLPTEALLKIQPIEAQKIADKCKALVMRELKTIKELEAGTASLGYTTQRQEIQARGELRKRFEFNCLQLRDFKVKYGIK